MNSRDRNFVIVGASFADAVAAGTLREEGFDERFFLVVAPGWPPSRGDGAVRRVRTSDGRIMEADLVVVATGVAPRTGLAERAGIDVDNGILADEFLQTSAPPVFVAGDAANARYAFYGRRLRVEHWGTAQTQGEVAVLNMLGKDVPYDRIPYFFSDQYETGMEYWGETAGAERLVFRGDPDTLNFHAFWLDAESRVAAGLNVHTHEHGHAHDGAGHEHHDHGDHDHSAAEGVRPIEALRRSRERLDARRSSPIPARTSGRSRIRDEAAGHACRRSGYPQVRFRLPSGWGPKLRQPCPVGGGETGSPTCKYVT